MDAHSTPAGHALAGLMELETADTAVIGRHRQAQPVIDRPASDAAVRPFGDNLPRFERQDRRGEAARLVQVGAQAREIGIRQ